MVAQKLSLESIHQNLEAIKGCKFVSFTYTNKQGETAKVLVNIGANFGSAKEKDAEILAAFEPSNELEVAAKEGLMKSLTNPSETASQAQKDAMVSILDGKFFFCPNTQNFLIWGKLEKKQVIVPGDYKETKKRELTIAKEKLEKQLSFGSVKFRRYNVENIRSVKINGILLELE
jgi:hypothetical protein